MRGGGEEGEGRVAVQCMRLDDVRLVNGWTHEGNTGGRNAGVAGVAKEGVAGLAEEERWGEADVDMDMASRLKKARMRLVQRDENTSGYRCLDKRIGITAGDITGGDIRSVDPRHLFQQQQQPQPHHHQQEEQQKKKKGKKGGQRGGGEGRGWR